MYCLNMKLYYIIQRFELYTIFIEMKKYNNNNKKACNKVFKQSTAKIFFKCNKLKKTIE